MKNIKRIPTTLFDKVIKNASTPTKTIEWNGIEVVIKETLSFKEMMTFVDSATKSCFDIDSGTYLPEVKDFAIKSCVLEMYTNLPILENSECMYDFIYCSNIIPTVLQQINRQQLDEILQAVNDKIDNLAQSNIEMINKQMNELYTHFNRLQNQLSKAFSGVGSNDITKLVSAISNGKLDESKLVQEYINQTKPNINQKIKLDNGEK